MKQTLIISKHEYAKSHESPEPYVVETRLARGDTLIKLNETRLREGHTHYRAGGVIRVQRQVSHRYTNGKYWVMSHKDKGWASSGVPYNSMQELMAANGIVLVRTGRDAVSHYYEFRPMEAGERSSDGKCTS